MNRALVVIETTETAKEIAREAGTLAEGVDAEVVMIHATTEKEYSARRQAMSSLSGISGPYTADTARTGAAQFAEDVAAAVLDDLDLHYESAGYVGEKGRSVLEAAEEYDCDHVFLTGRSRSPTGKALFGDATQRVLLDFDGPVTVWTS